MNSLVNSCLLVKASSPSFCVHVFSRVQAAWVGKIRQSQPRREYPNTDRKLPVYLLEDVANLGEKGNIVWVRPGYSKMLFPKKIAIPARIIDPYLRGPLYNRLLFNKLGAQADEANLTIEKRIVKSIELVEMVLQEKVLRIFPEGDFALLPEDVSLSFREVLRLNIPRECIGDLLEEGKRWPVRELGKFSFNVDIHPGTSMVGTMSVESPSVAEEEERAKEKKMAEKKKRVKQ